MAARARTRVRVPPAAAFQLWAFMPGGHSEQHGNSAPLFQDSGSLSLLSRGGACSEQAGHGPAVPVGPTGEKLHWSLFLLSSSCRNVKVRPRSSKHSYKLTQYVE